jgi:integrase
VAGRPRAKRGRGEGTIEELPSGLWRARLDAGFDASGKRQRLSRTFQQVTDARQWLREQLSKKDREGLVSTGSDTLAEWSIEWLTSKADTTESATSRKYRQHFHKHITPHLGTLKLRDLTATALNAWARKMADSGVSPAQRRKVMTTLSVALNDAVLAGRTGSNPLRGRGAVRRPKATTREVIAYTLDECKKLMQACEGERYGPLFRLLLDSGLRTGEALALTWERIDLETCKVRVTESLEEIYGTGKPAFRTKPPKTKAGLRTVTITRTTADALREMPGVHEGLVFTSDTNEKNQVSSVRVISAWKRISKRAGVAYKRPYTLRHTSASILIQSGVSIKTVSKRLGHEDISITLKFYSHLMPGSLSRAKRFQLVPSLAHRTDFGRLARLADVAQTLGIAVIGRGGTRTRTVLLPGDFKPPTTPTKLAFRSPCKLG